MGTGFMFESLPKVYELFPAALHPAHGTIFSRKLEVIEIDPKSGVSIIFKIRVFYKAWFEGFELTTQWVVHKVALWSFS